MARAHLLGSLIAVPGLLAGLLGGCPRESGTTTGATGTTPPHTADGADGAPVAPAPLGPSPGDAATALADDGGAGGPEMDDPMALHRDVPAELLALSGLPPESGARFYIGIAPGKFNQGNKAFARHRIAKRACLDGLKGLTLQTDEQRTKCGGAENMVPIKPNVCIDVFEFPNKACELPFVWGGPTAAQTVCKALGKRLCTQDEWVLGCSGDPAGGKRQPYAYGDKLDLEICNTNRPHPFGPDGKQWTCRVQTAQSTWESCNTETEPAGAFPKCRSRFGVFDQHGNVAEIMTRKDETGTVLSQLKGSAFFYVDVARELGVPQAKDAGSRETYTDQCSYDARWHIENMERAVHVNYHLGFRCCKDVKP